MTTRRASEQPSQPASEQPAQHCTATSRRTRCGVASCTWRRAPPPSRPPPAPSRPPRVTWRTPRCCMESVLQHKAASVGRVLAGAEPGGGHPHPHPANTATVTNEAYTHIHTHIYVYITHTGRHSSGCGGEGRGEEGGSRTLSMTNRRERWSFQESPPTPSTL